MQEKRRKDCNSPENFVYYKTFVPGYFRIGRSIGTQIPTRAEENPKTSKPKTYNFMKTYPTHEIKNVVLLGASGSGKTTLAEAMAFEVTVIDRR